MHTNATGQQRVLGIMCIKLCATENHPKTKIKLYKEHALKEHTILK
jgi:hypothetical protein